MTSLPQHRSVQGRRPSVGPTTARRRPSVRRRPGAGFLPAWRPAARVGAPKERFRVYAEDEYFAHGGQIAEVARDGSAWAVEGSVFSADVAAAEGAHGLRIAFGTVLIAGAGALGVVLALGVFASSTHVRRKTALRAARAMPGLPQRLRRLRRHGPRTCAPRRSVDAHDGFGPPPWWRGTRGQRAGARPRGAGRTLDLRKQPHLDRRRVGHFQART
jgi:hypothetical protein